MTDMDTPLADPPLAPPPALTTATALSTHVARRKMRVARPKLVAPDLGCRTGVRRRREIITGEFLSA
jgi:hypothetical protein